MRIIREQLENILFDINLVSTSMSEKTALAVPKFIKVKDIESSRSGYNVYVKVLSAERKIIDTRDGQKIPMVECVLADETATANGFFKGDNAQFIEKDNVIAIRNGLKRFVKNFISLEVDIFGRVTLEKNVTISTIDSFNISTVEHKLEPRPRRNNNNNRRPRREDDNRRPREDRPRDTRPPREPRENREPREAREPREDRPRRDNRSKEDREDRNKEERPRNNEGQRDNKDRVERRDNRDNRDNREDRPKRNERKYDDKPADRTSEPRNNRSDNYERRNNDRDLDRRNNDRNNDRNYERRDNRGNERRDNRERRNDRDYDRNTPQNDRPAKQYQEKREENRERRAPLQWTTIKEITPGDIRLNLIVKVVSATQVGRNVRVVIGDNTGVSNAFLPESADLVAGESIALFNARAEVVKEHIEIQLQRGAGRVERSRRTVNNVSEEFNLSEKAWVPVE